MRAVCYAIGIENAGVNYTACVPDLPGCVAVGDTLDEVERQIREAMEFHPEGLRAAADRGRRASMSR